MHKTINIQIESKRFPRGHSGKRTSTRTLSQSLNDQTHK